MTSENQFHCTKLYSSYLATLPTNTPGRPYGVRSKCVWEDVLTSHVTSLLNWTVLQFANDFAQCDLRNIVIACKLQTGFVFSEVIASQIRFLEKVCLTLSAYLVQTVYFFEWESRTMFAALRCHRSCLCTKRSMLSVGWTMALAIILPTLLNYAPPPLKGKMYITYYWGLFVRRERFFIVQQKVSRQKRQSSGKQNCFERNILEFRMKKKNSVENW